MFAPHQYQLLDFGEGRKLERFAGYVLDRPAPAAAGQPKSDPALWKTAQGRYTRRGDGAGRWKFAAGAPPDWTLRYGSLTLKLKPTPFGHVGVFAEQAANWDWIAVQARRADRALRVLNLFAYTGGSTLAAAAAGCQVVHVDAAKNIVAWARENARLSGLDEAPIRWIHEDAARFVARELRRGNHYDALILDPPSYGHGPQGQSWKIDQQLLPLLRQCGQLTARRRAFILLTCHSPGWGPAELEAMMADAVFGQCQSGVVARPISIRAADGRRLPSGTLARWPAD